MKIEANRVLLAFKSWEDKKNELQKLSKAGAADQRIIDGLQLQHLREAAHRLRNTARPDEQPFMALLSHHIRGLEKKLYPNTFLRLFLRLKDRLFDGPRYLDKLQNDRDINMAQLKAQLVEKGFKEIAGKLEKHLDPVLKEVCLPLDCQLSETKRLNFDLLFEKDVYGQFRLAKLGGMLLDGKQTVKSYEFDLADWPGLRSNHALNLLEGRALKQAYTDATGHENQRWVELGPEGARDYGGEHQLNVPAVLDTMPQLARYRPELIRWLENGQQVSAHWKQEGVLQQVELKADPANGTIKLLDNKLQPITSEQLGENAKKLAAAKKLKAPVQQQKRRNGHQLQA